MNIELNPIRIVIAGEQGAFRNDLRSLLASERDFTIVGEASDAVDVVRFTRQLEPDMLLLDVGLRGRRELLASNGPGRHLPKLKTVVMVTAIEKPQIVEAFRLGANGIVLKTSSPQILFKSIRSVMAGHYWLGSQSVAILVEALREVFCKGYSTRSLADFGLTSRELDIIAKIATGRSNKEVGQECSISERTVKHHLTSIFNKVGVSTRLELALFAVKQDLTTPGSSSLVPQPAVYAVDQANSSIR